MFPSTHQPGTQDPTSPSGADLSAFEAALDQLPRPATLENLVDFVYGACGGAFRPLQVRSEILRLMEILRHRRPRAVVEIGTASGGTLFLFCRVAAPDATIISIDLRDGRRSYSPERANVYQRFARPSQHLHLLRRDSHDPGTLEVVADVLAGRSVDLLFIDGDHSYEGVKLDYEMYGPLVTRSGLTAFHDIVPPNPPPSTWACEVDRFWMEAKQRAPHYELVESWDQGWAGIGLIAVP